MTDKRKDNEKRKELNNMIAANVKAIMEANERSRDRTHEVLGKQLFSKFSDELKDVLKLLIYKAQGVETILMIGYPASVDPEAFAKAYGVAAYLHKQSEDRLLGSLQKGKSFHTLPSPSLVTDYEAVRPDEAHALQFLKTVMHAPSTSQFLEMKGEFDDLEQEIKLNRKTEARLFLQLMTEHGGSLRSIESGMLGAYVSTIARLVNYVEKGKLEKHTIIYPDPVVSPWFRLASANAAYMAFARRWSIEHPEDITAINRTAFMNFLASQEIVSALVQIVRGLNMFPVFVPAHQNDPVVLLARALDRQGVTVLAIDPDDVHFEGVESVKKGVISERKFAKSELDDLTAKVDRALEDLASRDPEVSEGREEILQLIREAHQVREQGKDSDSDSDTDNDPDPDETPFN